MRLTNDRSYLQLKANVDGLRAKGFEVLYSDLIYIKLAEYERNEEKQKKSFENIVNENAALRAELKELHEMNSRLREALQRQTADEFVFD